MKTDISIDKEYRLYTGVFERILGVLSLGFFRGSERFIALQDFQCSIGSDSSGSITGIIGPNGAGKSTLLRILAGVTRPTRGTVRINGSVKSILELTAGFSPELNCIENLVLNAPLWDYSSREMKSAASEILEFAGLSHVTDHPLKTLSTGMQMRLAFALATHRKSDLLLVDEALSVGDASFQQRSVRRFKEFKEQGSTIIVVSHDLPLLTSIADEILLLSNGRLKARGRPSEMFDRYMQLIADQNRSVELAGKSHTMKMLNTDGCEIEQAKSAQKVIFRIQVHSDLTLNPVTAGIHLDDSRGLRISGTNSYRTGHSLRLQPGINTIDFECTLNLGTGSYTAGYSLHEGMTHEEKTYIWEDHALTFQVESDMRTDGVCFLDPQISYSYIEASEPPVQDDLK